MDKRDHDTHLTLTRVHAKFEQLDYAQAEAAARLERLRMEREGRWPDVVAGRATTP